MFLFLPKTCQFKYIENVDGKIKGTVLCLILQKNIPTFISSL